MDAEADVSAVSEPVTEDTPMNGTEGVRVVNGGLDNPVDTTFQTYPASRPFMDTDYQRSSDKPVVSFPQSNRDGVLSALQSLQEKMKKLEVERRQAESNLNTLATDTQLYKTSLHNTHFDLRPQPPHSNTDSQEEEEEEREGEKDTGVDIDKARPHQQHLESQLSSAETRCQLLEKQLEYMRKMVHTAERERTHAVQKAEVLQHHHKELDDTDPFSPEYRDQLDRINELERDHIRLTATQTLAQSKIGELERKLKEERQQRKLLQERAVEVESPRTSQQQIMLHTAPVPSKPPAPANSKAKKTTASKKKKKKVSSRKPAPVKSEPSKHYRLNLADIPFVAGKSTAPSHAVGANVQKVLALMKSHNMALCSNGHGHGHGGWNGESGGHSRSPTHSPSPVLVDQDLGDLLAQLQDEFGQLSIEHQEYLHVIQDTADPRIRQNLERELDSLVVRMEVKGQQISRVRQHQQRLEDATRTAKRANKKSDSFPRPSSAMGRLQTNHRHHHPHPHPQSQASGNLRPKSSTRSERDAKYNELAPPTLNILRDMKKLQTTLRRDDLSWE